MARPQSIFVKTDVILANIAAIAKQQHTATKARVKKDARSFWLGGHFYRLPLEERQQRCKEAIASALAEQLPQADWVARDLELLAGKSLTASERIRTQQAMKRLEADGVIELSSRHVRLTEAGRATLRATDG